MVFYRSVLLGSTCIWLILSLLGDCKCKPGWGKNSNKSYWPIKKLLNHKNNSKVSQERPQTAKSREKPQTEKSRPTPTQTYKKFGCEFEDENYFVYTDSLCDVVFGEEVSPMYFSSMEKFEAMKAEIDKEYTKVMADVIYTDLPMMLDFYDAYKTYQNKMEGKKGTVNIAFFHEYVPKFHRHECVGLAVELLEKLVNRFPNMSENVHLVTSTVLDKNGEKILSDLRIVNRRAFNSKMSAAKPPEFGFQNEHVAALLRVNIKGNLGYVLMDPGLDLKSPALIMEDNEKPESVSEFGSNGVPYSKFYLPRKNYVYSESSARRPSEKHRVMRLYYIGRPYCSFLMTTMKPTVLEPEIHIKRRNKEALPVASIHFDLSIVSNTTILMMRRNGPNYPKYYDDRVPFAERDEKETTKQLYNEVMKIMKYDGLEELLWKAQTIKQDEEFLHYISETQELVNLFRRGLLQGWKVIYLR